MWLASEHIHYRDRRIFCFFWTSCTCI